MGFLTPNAQGELNVLKTYALQQLAQLRTTVVGLSDEQAHSTPTASVLNLTGLLLHCGEVAAYWATAAASAPEPPTFPERFEEHDMDTLMADRSTLAETLRRFDALVGYAAAQYDAVTDLAAPVPVPQAPWFPPELKSWEARFSLNHINTEIARHAGHADILRESIDGKGAYELNDLADAEAAAASGA